MTPEYKEQREMAAEEIAALAEKIIDFTMEVVTPDETVSASDMARAALALGVARAHFRKITFSPMFDES